MLFNRALRKYNLLVDRGILAELLSKTLNATLLWEIPKGRSNRKETPIVSATREFEEETGLTKDRYRILFDEGTIEYSFVDCNVRYKYIYYIAITNKNVVPKYDYGNEHMVRELSELVFMRSSAIRELNNKRLAKTAKIIIKKAKRYLA
jgi:8-oxo-dGTP pyrophosphatase MutT (NUDIX family)